MATLAVNALLLGAGPPARRTVAASAGAGWSDPGACVWRSVASLRPYDPATSHAASTTTASPKGKLFGRHRDDAQPDGARKSRRSSGGEPRRGHTRGVGAAAGRTATEQNMLYHHTRRWLGWVQGEHKAEEDKKGGLWRSVIGIRAAVAAAVEGGAAATKEEERAGSRAGLGNRFWCASTASCDGTVRPHERQPKHQDSVCSRAAAIINTALRMPSVGGSAAGVGVTAVGAAAAAVASPAPVPSYLQWPSKTKNAAEPADEGRNAKKNLSSGVGSRAGGSGSNGEATTTESDEGSLGAAKSSRGGGGGAAVSLSFREAMFAGAVSRSVAQTCMQPANVVKTLLQGRGTASQLKSLSFKLLTRGAGAQFVMSLPHGAFNYATLEVILGCSAKIFPDEWRERAGPVLDFFSSSVATLVCSVVSTPQMVITDRIMAGMYPNLVSGVREITRNEGLPGFYTGWSANVAQKIPSYGLTWVFFQQFKRLHRKATDRPPTNTENFMLGAAAAGATVCIMIPMDTVKTRLVTQTAQAGVVPYKGVLQTLARIVKEEGIGPIYRSLTPRLVSVVPMIGIQFGIYEFVRKEIMSRKDEGRQPRNRLPPAVRRTLGMDYGALQQGYFKDFLNNVRLMEEEMV
eukprot:g11383.t1